MFDSSLRICGDEGFRCVALRMSRIDDMLSARDAKLDDPALKDTESDKYEGNKRSCLYIVHWNPAGWGKLAALYGGHQIRPGKRDHIQEKDQLKRVIDKLENRLSLAREKGNELFNFNRKAFFAAIADT